MTTTALILSPSPSLVPGRLFAPTPKAARCVLEFFTAQINNDHTRKAYLNAARRFAQWCEAHGLHELAHVQPFHVAALVKGRAGVSALLQLIGEASDDQIATEPQAAPAHQPCSPDGSRARTENHPARLCEAGHGSRWRQGPSGRGGLRRGGAGRLPRAPGPWQVVRWGSGPVLVPVSAHGSANDRNCALASTMRLTMPNSSKLLRARRSP